MSWRDTIQTEEPSNWKASIKQEPEPSFLGITPSGVGRATLEALPIAGSIAGGIAGSGLGPVGTVGGAGLGAAAGKSLEQFGKDIFFNERKPLEENIKELGKEGAYGALAEVGGQAAGKVLGKGIEYGAETGIPKIKSLLGKGADYVTDTLLPKLGHSLTGVSEQEIKTYAKRADQVKNLAKLSDASTIEAADQIRTQFNKDIGSKIGSINQEIGDILSTSNKHIESTPIYDALEKYKSKLNPNLHIEDIKSIEDLQNRILNATKGDKIPIGIGNDIKQFLQEKAQSAYRNGDMFQIGKEAANAAKGGAAEARKLIDIAEPKVTELNSTLSKFHGIEESMNPNLLKVGAPEAGLLAAGTAGNPRNARALQQLGELTGTPMLEQAENLAAMRTFTNPPILPVDTTGKSATRVALGAGLGGLFGGPAGAAIGSAISSPFALKGVIEAGRAGKAIVPLVEQALPSAPSREILYKGLMQKYLEGTGDNETKPQAAPPQRQDVSQIMEKTKGTPYEKVLNQAMENGGQQSFAAANYVLKNRDQNYRMLFGEE